MRLMTNSASLRSKYGKARLVSSRFSCLRCGLWVGFDEFTVHQGKNGKGFALIDRLPYSMRKGCLVPRRRFSAGKQGARLQCTYPATPRRTILQ